MAKPAAVGRKSGVRRSVLLQEPEAEAAWPAILERSPDYERYLRATDRTIPLIRLRRLPTDAGSAES